MVGKERPRLRLLSAAAGARTDGTPLRPQPHDCRRVFATKRLNTTPCTTQALLGLAVIRTVKVPAKL
jgi:hypothetical protein